LKNEWRHVVLDSIVSCENEEFLRLGAYIYMYMFFNSNVFP